MLNLSNGGHVAMKVSKRNGWETKQSGPDFDHDKEKDNEIKAKQNLFLAIT